MIDDRYYATEGFLEALDWLAENDQPGTARGRIPRRARVAQARKHIGRPLAPEDEPYVDWEDADGES